MFIKSLRREPVDMAAVSARAAELDAAGKNVREIQETILREFDVVMKASYNGKDRPGGRAAARRLRQQPRCPCGAPRAESTPLCPDCLIKKWL